MGYSIQVTEYKYSIPVLRNDPLSNGLQFVTTCPVFAGWSNWLFFCFLPAESVIVGLGIQLNIGGWVLNVTAQLCMNNLSLQLRLS